MQVTTIGVVGLSTSSQYADGFRVEIYSDSGYTALIQALSSSAVWDGDSAWNQSEPIFFDGLTVGVTYYLRAAVLAPNTGALGAWTNWTAVAGTFTAPACVFGGSYTGTLSGVHYLLDVTSVPADIDHYDAWWSYDGSAPSGIAGKVASWNGPFDGRTTPAVVAESSAAVPIGAAARTICCFITSTNTSSQGILGYGATGTGTAWALGTGTASPGMPYFAGWFADLTGTVNVCDGVRHHVAVSYDGSTLRMYIDGVLNVSNTVALATPAGTTFDIGNAPAFWGLSDAAALIEDVAVYDSALSSGQLDALITGGSVLPMVANITPATSFPVFATGVPGQSVTLFMRGVNTAQVAQAWVAVGGTIPVMATVNAAGAISSTAIVAGKSVILGNISDLANGTVGFNSLANPHFTLPANSGSGDDVFLGFKQITTFGYVTASSDATQEFSGTPTLKLSTTPLALLPTGITDEYYASSSPLPVTPKTKFFAQAQVKTGEDFALPTGVAAFTEIGMLVTYADATTTTHYLPALTADMPWQSVSGQLVVPAVNGTSLPATVQFYIHTRLNNTSGAAVTLPNGSVWTTWIDHVVLNKAVAFTDQEIAKNGSIPISYAQAMSYTASDTAISWSWAINIYRTDNNLTVTSSSGTSFVDSLTASTTYYFYPYYDEDAELVGFVAGGTGSDGTAHAAADITLTQAQSRCDRVPLSTTAVPASTGATAAAPPSPGTDQFSYDFVSESGTWIMDYVTVNYPGTTYPTTGSYGFFLRSSNPADYAATGTINLDGIGGIASVDVDNTGTYYEASPTVTFHIYHILGGGTGGGTIGA